MNVIDAIYGSSLALLTDLYQLTMWKPGRAEDEAVRYACRAYRRLRRLEVSP